MGEYAEEAFDRALDYWLDHICDIGCEQHCVSDGPFMGRRRSFTKEEKREYAHRKAREEDIEEFKSDPIAPEEGVGRWSAASAARLGVSNETPKQEKTKMSNNTKSTRKPFMTPTFRLSFPNLFQASAAVQGQEPKFSLTMIFEKGTDITVLKQQVIAAAAEKWGPDQAKWPANITWPFRKGSEKAELGYPADSIFASASSKMRPGVVDQKVQDVIDPNVVYGGCYARATVTTYAWEYMGKRGVSFGLRNVQMVKDGEPFAGKNKPQDDFDALPDPGASPAAAGTAGTSTQAGVGGIDLGV